MKQPLGVQGYLSQNVSRHLEASCFQQGIEKRKGSHYEERFVFFLLFLEEKERG